MLKDFSYHVSIAYGEHSVLPRYELLVAHTTTIFKFIRGLEPLVRFFGIIFSSNSFLLCIITQRKNLKSEE